MLEEKIGFRERRTLPVVVVFCSVAFNEPKRARERVKLFVYL